VVVLCGNGVTFFSMSGSKYGPPRNTSSYNPEHLEALKSASVDDYQTFFLASHGADELPNQIRWSLRWADTDHAEITVKAKEALERIKTTSLLNAIRVGTYGV
jgi:hypothetical protein